MKPMKRMLSSLLATALLCGLMCLGVGAEASGGASSSHIPEDASQGALHTEAGQVTLSMADGPEIIFTSAHLGGYVSFSEPFSGETATLRTIIIELGCISYALSPDGQVYSCADGTEYTWMYDFPFCHFFALYEDGTLEGPAWANCDLTGNAYANFGLNNASYCTFTLLGFYADDDRYCLTTQEALDLFCQSTGAQLSSSHASSTFADVSPSVYYAKAVDWAVEHGVTAGTSETTFSPDAIVTRAQAVTFLWNAAGKPEPQSSSSPFTDVTDPGAYYYKAVLWAAQQGITSGVGGGLFGPDQDLAYDQILTFLCNAAGETGSGSDWSEAALNWAAQQGITNGLSFSAKNSCPRRDVVYCLWKQLA